MIDERYKQIGRRIYEAREAADWSQKQLADALGYRSQATLWYYEAGQRKISIFDIYRIAEIFRIPVTALLDLGDGLEQMAILKAENAQLRATLESIRNLVCEGG
jgi:transcriptional regulator with XRE-family HTH domain